MDFVKNKLGKTSPDAYSKSFIKLMFHDEVFNVVGWATNNAKEKRLSAISLKTFGQFVTGK